MNKTKRVISLILFCSLIAGLMSGIPVLASAPDITTEAAYGISYYEATIAAYVNTNGGNYFAEHGFYYGTTSSCKTKVVVGSNGGSGVSLNTPARYTYTLDDLDIGTKYYFKAYVLTTDGTYYYGGVGEFTTKEDNALPVINPISSSAGTSFEFGTYTTFSTKASDNVELDKIEMFIDGNSVKTITTNTSAGVSRSISYSTDDLAVGAHTVTVKAWDTAENMNQTSITVTVVVPEETDPKVTGLTVTGQTSSNYIDETFTFSGTAVNASKVRLTINGNPLFSAIVTVNSSGSFSYSYTDGFSSGGTKTIRAVPLDSSNYAYEGGDRTATVTTRTRGNVGSFTPAQSSLSVEAGSSVTLNWGAPSSPTGMTIKYTVILYVNGEPEHLNEKQTGRSFTISGSVTAALSPGSYGVQIIATASGYEPYTAPITLTITSPAYTLGDVNGDGRVTALDRFALNRWLASGGSGYSIDEQAADINGDHSVTQRDALILTRHLAGWIGYENLDGFTSVIQDPSSGDTCPPHTPVGGETWYHSHVYEDLVGNDSVHKVAAIVWDCICGRCGESFQVISETGYEGDPLPRNEAHSYDQYGVCTKCFHRCSHSYQDTGEIVPYSGVWSNCGDGTHVRTSSIHIFRCTNCGVQKRVRVDQVEAKEAHVIRNDDNRISVDRLSTENADYYSKHTVTIDRYKYCSARNQGCDYRTHEGNVVITEAHKFVNGVCECGMCQEELPVKIGSLFIKYGINGVTQYVTGEGIQFCTTGSGQYISIAAYESSGKQVSDSSETGTYRFVLRADSNGYLNDKQTRVYWGSNTNDDYTALRQDNYTFHLNKTGKFYIDVLNNSSGACLVSIPVEVQRDGESILKGSDFYSVGDYGYNKVVIASSGVNSLSTEAKRLWFDLNTPLGSLKLMENMPVFTYDYLADETKASFWWKYQRAVQKGAIVVTSFPSMLVSAFKGSGKDLFNTVSTNEKNREDARLIADYLMELEASSDTCGVPDVEGYLQSVGGYENGLGIILELADLWEEWGNYGYVVKEWKTQRLDLKKVYDLFDYLEMNKGLVESWTNVPQVLENAGITVGLNVLFGEIELAAQAIRADAVLEKLDEEMNRMGVSGNLKEAVRNALLDDQNRIDDSLCLLADSLTDVAAGALVEAAGLPVTVVMLELKVGSAALGYQSFDDAYTQLVNYVSNYEKAKPALALALKEFAKYPSPSRYSAVVAAKNNYANAARMSNLFYKSFLEAEASIPVKQLFTDEQSFIDNAYSQWKTDDAKLDKYINQLSNGALAS